MDKYKTSVQILEIKINQTLVGYLAGYNDGRYIFTFAHEYIEMNETRPTFSLKYYRAFEDDFRKKVITNYKLHPIFSNLLPEKELREYTVKRLKISSDDEFELLSALGRDLPGAFITKKLKKDEIPPYALEGRAGIEQIIKNDDPEKNDKFSLAGVVMKFSMYEESGTFHMSKSNKLGNLIIKTPHNIHKNVPLNEFTSMKLAEAAGISIPEVKLVRMSNISGLPDIKFGDEEYAYAIKRFDRKNNLRIHTEDFAQILENHAKDKYKKYNYEIFANIIYNEFPKSLDNINEFFTRLVVNIMIGNGDAHLKNWSVIYSDQIKPSLTPAYDILFTRAYTTEDDSIAFNIGGEKLTAKLEIKHFQKMAKSIDLDWKLVEKRVKQTISDAREKWPSMLNELPMDEKHKKKLREYWKGLSNDFKIGG